MTFLTLITLPSVLAEEVSSSSVPSACQAICSPIVQLTTTCDVDPGEMDMDDMDMDGKDKDMDMGNMPMRKRMDMSSDEEKVEADCICNNKSFDVGAVMPLCASCMAQNANETAVEDAADINRIMSQCSFTSTTYAPSATSLLSDVQVQATQPAITMMAGMDSQMGVAGRVEATPGVWAMGMVLGSLGLGGGLLAGIL
ncbi:hypothetical protein K458DRAFT_323138 [Lentithecium fluviatile CBS 122367]|uniref:Uncharacterized protein n=1 Tax=Lentithecium fluviatile CBS 122367 TaxID=1168545 RepID=A0A6G1IDG5_9PLEO|nr:hypothetical protein K458DRAFT_323138 [Lentithecium fluviatile CBS 122367]